mgnify:FL=1
MHSLVAHHFLGGGNYPNGSSKKIAETVSTLIEKNDGKLAVNSHVKEIILKNGKAHGVRMENGDELEASKTVSSVGVVNTFEKLICNVKNQKFYDKSFKIVKKSGSYLCLYIGLNKSAKDLGLKNTNLWIYPGYGHDNNVKRYKFDSEQEFPVV